MKVGLDLDNVIVPLYEKMIDIVNSDYGLNIKLEDWKSYKMSDSFSVSEDAVEEIYQHLLRNRLLPEFECYAHAKKVINNYSQNLDFYFITARYLPTKVQTLEWFFKSGLFYKEENIYFDDEKSGLAKDLGIEVFVEDHPEIAERLASKGILVYLYDQPWNQGVKENSLIKRIKDWFEIEKNFRNILQPS